MFQLIISGKWAQFASAFPDVLVEIWCENSDVIKKSVDKGELDVGICTQISDGGQVISHDPSDLKIVGLENGLPVLPVSNIVLHKTRKVTSEII